jgi:hypothetical protein
MSVPDLADVQATAEVARNNLTDTLGPAQKALDDLVAEYQVKLVILAGVEHLLPGRNLITWDPSVLGPNVLKDAEPGIAIGLIDTYIPRLDAEFKALCTTPATVQGNEEFQARILEIREVIRASLPEDQRPALNDQFTFFANYMTENYNTIISAWLGAKESISTYDVMIQVARSQLLLAKLALQLSELVSNMSNLVSQ